jgi:hypothetical protein
MKTALCSRWMAVWVLPLGLLALTAHAGPKEPEPPAAAETSREELPSRVQRAARAAMEGQLAAARGELFSLTDKEARQPSVLFLRACIALEEGNLDGAARDIATLRARFPRLAEARVLVDILTLRREQPSVDWLEAFIQAWNGAGRPDFRDSGLLIEDKQSPHLGREFEDSWHLVKSPEARMALALALAPEAERGRFVLEHVRELNPPEMIFAADWYLQQKALPEPLRAEAAKVLRARLSKLAAASPRAMQYPAMLLLRGSSPDAPLTPKDVLEIEAIAALPDWRETGFRELIQTAQRQLEATGLPHVTDYAFSLAAMGLASEPLYLLKKRAEASREGLSPEELRRLGEALWRMGSLAAAESTILERMLGLQVMQVGAIVLKDEDRLQQASTQYEEALAAWQALRAAALDRWPLRSLRASLVEASMRDEAAYIRRFLPTPSPAP